MSDQIMFFQAGEVCQRDCRFESDDSSLTGQCPGKDSSRCHIFSCDRDALTDSYKRGAEREREKFAEALKRRNEIRGQAK